MRVLLAVAGYSYRATTPSKYFLLNWLLFPLVQPAFFALIGSYGGGQPIEFYVVGNAMAFAAASAHVLALSMTWDRNQGVLLYAIASPASRIALVCGAVAPRLLETFMRVLLAFVWAWAVFGLTLPLSEWLAILLSVAFASFAACGLSLVVGAISFIVLDASLLGTLLVLTLLLVSGANVPVAELPPLLQGLGQALPLTRSIEAARQIAAGRSIMDALPLLAGELLIGLAYLAAGIVVFRWFESRARRRGTLEGV